MTIEELLKNLTHEFIQIWNEWRIDELGKFFKEDIVVYSPFITVVFPDNLEGKLAGKKNVLEYWRLLKNIGYDKKFSLVDFNRNGHTVTTTFAVDNSEQKMITTYIYNEYGKMSELRFEYL